MPVNIRAFLQKWQQTWPCSQNLCGPQNS